MNYTIVDVHPEPRVWNEDGKYQGGPKADWSVRVRDDQGVETAATWSKKTTSPPPQPGETVDANLEPSKGNWPPKLKPASTFTGGGGRQRDPKETQAIARMAAAKAAVGLVQAKAAAGLATEEDFKPSKLTDLINWFVADAQASPEASDPIPF